MLMNLWKYLVHAAHTLWVCIGKEIIQPECVPLLNLKTLERRSGGGRQTIYQTHETALQDWSVYQATAQTVNMNEDYDYQFFTAAERLQFLVDHFGAESEHVRAYQTVTNGAIRADIFRLCILYVRGGVYLDCKSATVHPLRAFLPHDTGFAMFIESEGTRLGNGFIASAPRNRLLGSIMNEAIRRTLAKDYGESPLDVTGPELFGSVVRRFLRIDQLCPGRYDVDGVKVDLLGIMNFFNYFMYTRPDFPVIKRQPDTYFFSIKRMLTRYEWSWVAGTYFQ